MKPARASRSADERFGGGSWLCDMGIESGAKKRLRGVRKRSGGIAQRTLKVGEGFYRTRTR
jgi:hypothetical protein